MIEQAIMPESQIGQVTVSAESNLYKISDLTAAESAEWDAYVMAAPDGLPLHLSGWRDVMQRNSFLRAFLT